MFVDDDTITFGFDQWRRLRMTMLPDYRPLAAWLHTDVQPNLAGLHGFLADTANAPDLARLPGYPEVSRHVTERRPPDGGRPALVDHTYFPPEWSEQDVRAAGEGAWRSAEALYDEHTGAWSGLWRGMEVSGYYEPGTGTVQTYFPVLAP